LLKTANVERGVSERKVVGKSHKLEKKAPTRGGSGDEHVGVRGKRQSALGGNWGTRGQSKGYY